MWHSDFCCRVYAKKSYTYVQVQLSNDHDNNLAEAPKNPQQNLLNGRCFFESLRSDLDDAVSQHPRYLLYITIQIDLQFYEPFSCHRLRKDVAEKNRCDKTTTWRTNNTEKKSSKTKFIKFLFICVLLFLFSRNESSFAVLSSWIGSPFFSRDGDVGCGKSMQKLLKSSEDI